MKPAWMTARMALGTVLAVMMAAGCGIRSQPVVTTAGAPTAIAAADGPAHGPAKGPALRIIGTVDVPSGIEVLGTPLGGLSGIDYDAASDQYLLISDDRSSRAPARVYTARIALDAQALQPPQWLQVRTLLHAAGVPYAPSRRAAGHVDVPDAEAVRWLPGAKQFVWTSEGDFARGFGPRLRVSAADGAAVR
ncbi:MAG: esterase-like activity of phytase family protein, partial [Acidovorax sp.]|uniref:esterase-like activity of phytase family protein n=1 Tax=Acidovorax sp. TaxID=1872122 RepID=UPI00260F4874